ncbi:MAG: cupin domain-containing protein [Burkholderiales bacterium]|nr:cupin domain-containing protein [Burkholderiales bacterium]
MPSNSPNLDHQIPEHAVLTQLGDVSVAQFMREDWHVNAKVFRNVFPDFNPVCSIDDLLELATQGEAETRLITAFNGRWEMQAGPLDSLPSLSERHWTALIQGLNLHLPSAAALLNRFRFVPEARLDDLMVSIASDGGGVGAHFDSYDVFLLQMHGQRRWRISAQTDLSLEPDLPLKILKNFQATEEFVLNPGDMLYLPPRYAHEGVAIGECTTLSIGFRAPTAAELLASVYRQAADDIEQHAELLNHRFQDPLRGACSNPGELPQDMLSWTQQLLSQQPVAKDSIIKGLLVHCTEPKDTVYFDPPPRSTQASKALRALHGQGIELSEKSRLICASHHFSINGELFEYEDEQMKTLIHALSATRKLDKQPSDQLTSQSPFIRWCVDMFNAGWLKFR